MKECTNRVEVTSTYDHCYQSMYTYLLQRRSGSGPLYTLPSSPLAEKPRSPLPLPFKHPKEIYKPEAPFLISFLRCCIQSLVTDNSQRQQTDMHVDMKRAHGKPRAGLRRFWAWRGGPEVHEMGMRCGSVGESPCYQAGWWHGDEMERCFRG